MCVGMCLTTEGNVTSCKVLCSQLCFYFWKQELPVSTRPIFCCTMRDVVVCFTGFKDKDHLVWHLSSYLISMCNFYVHFQHHLCNFVHSMGGSVRKEMINSVTHVVANTVFGSKYKVTMYV